MACAKCAAIAAERPIKRPPELAVAIRATKQAVADGTLKEIPAGPGASGIIFSALDPDGPWGDEVFYKFRCRACGQTFSLYCETYHGAGGRWTAEEMSFVQRVLGRLGL